MRDGENQVKNFVPMGGVDVMPLASKRGFGPRTVQDHRLMPFRKEKMWCLVRLTMVLWYGSCSHCVGLDDCRGGACTQTLVTVRLDMFQPRHGTSWDVPSLPAGERGYSINVQFPLFDCLSEWLAKLMGPHPGCRRMGKNQSLSASALAMAGIPEKFNGMRGNAESWKSLTSSFQWRYPLNKLTP